nr:hypothetical protein BgiMline_029959 [Biomphalaria glabrata]
MTGDEVTGDEVTGDEVTGDEMTGDEVTGDEVTGDEVTGDEMTSTDWLIVLATGQLDQKSAFGVSEVILMSSVFPTEIRKAKVMPF